MRHHSSCNLKEMLKLFNIDNFFNWSAWYVRINTKYSNCANSSNTVGSFWNKDWIGTGLGLDWRWTSGFCTFLSTFLTTPIWVVNSRAKIFCLGTFCWFLWHRVCLSPSEAIHQRKVCCSYMVLTIHPVQFISAIMRVLLQLHRLRFACFYIHYTIKSLSFLHAVTVYTYVLNQEVHLY